MKYLSHTLILPAILSVLSAYGSTGTDGKNRYVKHLVFPEGATIEQKVEMAAHLVPEQRQLEWQKRELTAFLHFGINTFTDREWGDGTEDPTLFNPEQLDAGQWVRTLKECGFEMVILTAKHHDGFCLWPTATTKHSVASSPWRDGKGDVVAELSRACAEQGMKFGVYLSPWDRNAECYGDSPRYNDFFVAQLTELLTNYGPVAEVWFDGACGEGPNGRRQEYDWSRYMQTIRTLQPDAVSAVMGEDVRWVGNEGGVGRETEWSATVLIPEVFAEASQSNEANGVYPMAKDLGSREKIASAREMFWYPSEVDVSIRPGWFWHARQSAEVKSVEKLADIYFTSVGRNSVLLLNIPPDSRGLIDDADVNRLYKFAEWRNATFEDNRVRCGKRLHKLDEGRSVVYKFKKPSVVDVIMLREKTECGQRVESFTVEAKTAEGWHEVARGTTVGHKRLLRIEPVEATALRVTIDGCRAKALLCGAGAYLSAPTAPEVSVESLKLLPREGRTLLEGDALTLDLGSEQTIKGFVYTPANGVYTPATAVRYRFSTSLDGNVWESAAEGEFGNIANNPVAQVVELDAVRKARYVRLEGTALDGSETLIPADDTELIGE
ncbi:MAG: alpha-L-fucosidase [Alistipes sp.]|nr:alpha-L-fucosidase [Alistipes sp.]